jgi:pyruvate dehydrogenase E2 component (dihydrolipoamide acetyltransferase)
MPAVAAGATEVVLSEWPLDEKQAFHVADTYAVIETDKASVDLEAEKDGVLLRRLVPAGAKVAIGDPIALVADQGEDVPDVDAALALLSVSVTSPEDAIFPERRDVPEPAQAVPASRSRVFASPLARRLARDAGLAHTTLTGTGPGGRIVRRDVLAAIAAQEVPAPSPALPARPTTTDVPHTRLRRAVAATLTRSKQQAPHFYVRGTCRVDALLALRTQLNEGRAVRISLNDLVVKAVARAHELVPEMNVVWTDNAVRHHTTVDVAVAVATDGGLLTPVVTDVANRRIGDLAATTRDLAERAQAGALRQAELEGGTVTVSNLGMHGVEEFSAIINPPHASILAVGGVCEEAVAVDGGLAVAQVMKVVLSVDHRPVDGVVAARWMQALVGLVEQPAGILA